MFLNNTQKTKIKLSKSTKLNIQTELVSSMETRGEITEEKYISI
jgi:hypothetical protein